MTDPYPQTLQIEIDRRKLCRYLRVQAILCWTITLVIISSLIGVATYLSEEKVAKLESVADICRQSCLGLGIGAATGLLLGLFCYLVFHHFSTRREADSLHVSVEGQFLRVREGSLFRRDRKLHFRAIVDYACFQGPLMRRCGITGIAMTTMAGGQGAGVNILAVKDAPKIRDMLSDIDRLREDLHPA